MGHRSFNDLVALVAQLRAEEGCPWDRAQDHRSLRPYLLEEAHEAIRRTWEAVKQKEGRVNYPLPTILAARKLAEQLGDECKINKADYPSSEVAEGGRILAAIAAAWKKKIDPEIALKKAIAHLSSVEREAH